MKKITPFNIDLMFATDADVRGLAEVKSSDIYDGLSSSFKDDGLFSVEIFGRPGTPTRESAFSFIRLNTSVIHPAIFDVLKRLKSLYIEIMMGRKYAIFDKEAGDFYESDMLDGNTGFAFFTEHLKDLTPDKRKSVKRNLYIDVFEKYKNQCLMDKCLVIPAMYRDISQDEEGRDVQDEINDMYRKLLSGANSINLTGARANDPMVDMQRRGLQTTMNDIYAYLMKMLEGKKGMIQSKWGSRRIAYGTRNVISSVETTAKVLGSPTAPSVDDIQIGLYQTIRGAIPFTINGIKEKFTNQVFYMNGEPVTLYNRKTLKPEQVTLDPYVWDKWGTSEGLEKIIGRFEEPTLRNKPIVIDGRYLALIYEKENTFRILINGEEVDPNHSEVHPMTYAEFFYLSNYEGWYTLRSVNTRYPINNMYSIYPARIYTKTTLESYQKYELGPDYMSLLGLAREYPVRHLDASWINTSIPSFTRLSNLGADFK